MKEKRYEIVIEGTDIQICWFGKNASGKYGTKEKAEKVAKEMNDNAGKGSLRAVARPTK